MLNRFVCLLLFLLFIGVSCVYAKNTTPAVMLTQKHYYWGQTCSLMSLNGVRIENQGRFKYTLVAAAPDWTVTVFRDDDKTFVRQNFRDFTNFGIVNDLVCKWLNGKDTMHGAKKFTTYGQFKIDNFKCQREEYEYLPLGKLAALQANLIHSFVLKVRPDGGIPVKFIRVLSGKDPLTGLDATGTHRMYLTTSKIENKVVSNDVFTAPKGYKECRSMQEVLLSKISREASGDFDEMFENRTKGK